MQWAAQNTCSPYKKATAPCATKSLHRSNSALGKPGRNQSPKGADKAQRTPISVEMTSRNGVASFTIKSCHRSLESVQKVLPETRFGHLAAAAVANLVNQNNQASASHAPRTCLRHSLGRHDDASRDAGPMTRRHAVEESGLRCAPLCPRCTWR